MAWDEPTPPDPADPVLGLLADAVLACLDARAKVGPLLREHRRRECLTLEGFAAGLGVGKNTVKAVEDGRQAPTGAFLSKLAGYLVRCRRGG